MTCMNIITSYQLADNKTHANRNRYITICNKFSNLPIVPYQTTEQIIQVNPLFVLIYGDPIFFLNETNFTKQFLSL